MRRIILFLSLLLVSQISSADTYNALPTWSSPFTTVTSSTLTGLCVASNFLTADQIANGYTVIVESGGCYRDYNGARGDYHAGVSYSCPYGGIVSGTSCIDAPACPTGEKRNATTGKCEPSPYTCNYTPTLTTVGTTQTISWQIDNGTSCTDQSLSCTAPLVANTEQKRCDLTCDDGTTVNVDGGQSCPAPVCVGGQTLNTSTNKCDEPVCSSTQYLDSSTHTCQSEPVCIGEDTLDTLSTPHSCMPPTCSGDKSVYDTASHTCVLDNIPECVGEQSYNPEGNNCVDPQCASGFFLNASKVCEFRSCPAYTQKTTVEGVITCAAQSTSTSTTSTTDQTSTTSTPASSSTTTTTNPDGTTTTSTTDYPQSSTTQTGESTTTSTCDDCAKETTQRDVSNKLSSDLSITNTGQGEFTDETTAQIEQARADLKALSAQIKSDVSTIFSANLTGEGGLPIIEIGRIKGADVTIDFSRYSELFYIIGNIIYLLAIIASLYIILS